MEVIINLFQYVVMPIGAGFFLVYIIADDMALGKVAKIGFAIGLSVVYMLTAVLSFVFTRENDEWKRLDCKAYSAMEDIVLLKRIMKIDRGAKKEVNAVGGVEAMLDNVGGKLGEKERKRFANLVFLNDALVGMGASQDDVTAILNRAKSSHVLRTEMNVDDVAAILPVVVELYTILRKIDTSSIDVAEWLVDDYIDNKSLGNRAKTVRRIRKYADLKGLRYKVLDEIE